jgi:hypothetical protein
MSGVFQNIVPPPPSPPGECVVYPPPLVRGEGTLAGWVVNILEDPDTALYSTYVSTLCLFVNLGEYFVAPGTGSAFPIWIRIQMIQINAAVIKLC